MKGKLEMNGGEENGIHYKIKSLLYILVISTAWHMTKMKFISMKISIRETMIGIIVIHQITIQNVNTVIIPQKAITSS
jgi:hypothetical protein